MWPFKLPSREGEGSGEAGGFWQGLGNSDLLCVEAD